MKSYAMYYTTSRCNVTLHLGLSSSSSPPTYYGKCSICAYVTNKPHIQLKAGETRSAPVVAAAKLHTTSRNIQLGVGGPAGSIVWEDMRREKLRLKRSDYEFDTSLAEAGTQKSYSWGREKVMARTVYKCMDDEGKVVATLSSGGMVNWKKAGEIEVVEGMDKPLEQLLILGALAIWYAEAGWSLRQGYKSGSGKQDVGSGSDVRSPT